MRSLTRCLTPLLSIAALLFAAGCNSGGARLDSPPPGVTPMMAYFSLEVRGDASGAVPLPISGLRIPVNTGPVLREYDIARVSIGQTERLGPCLIFQFRPDAAHDLSRMSTQYQGYRLVLSINGRPVGVTTITAPINNGTIVIIPEVDPKDMPLIADGINFVSDQYSKALR